MKKILFLLLMILSLWTLGACGLKNIPIEDDDPVIQEPGDDPVVGEPDEDPIVDEIDEVTSARIQAIIDEMTLEDKVGQMFMVGFNGTSVPSSLNQAIDTARFGNFIYFGANVADDSLVSEMSRQIQNKVMSTLKIPAFISMDQEGGMVVRFAGEATHFIGNMALAATLDPHNAYLVGQYSGMELRHFGINTNLAPVLDVNNNPDNPVIGIRSYSDDAQTVSDFGLQMIEGLRSSQVMATVKHFPGHGDTSIDSHYGLPMIPHDLDRLYDIELAPFIDAIEAGVDTIMTAHIIFSAIDSDYPATLSYKVLTELLRNTLGYEGLIMTDEMRMNAIQNNFSAAEAAVLAVQAGVDILLYAESTSTSLQAIEGILEALDKGTLKEERIDASVRRILEKKIKYGLFEDYLPREDVSTSLFATHRAWNQSLVEDSITMPIGHVDWFQKEQKTLLISTVCTRYPLENGYQINTTANSLAMVGANYLQQAGVEDVDANVISSTLTTTQINTIVNQAKGYSQVVIAVENVSASQATLINELAKENFNLLVVALRNPYDYQMYVGVEHYVCTYGYFQSSVQAIMDLLLGKFEAVGILPVHIDNLNS
ncbi:MAG: glycoside hydrolase family 3 protein [Bacilli bacterium]